MSTPNMGLTVPVVLSTVGPDYATEINADLSLIDSHNHSSGFGALVPTAGLNINADLTFAGFNATNVLAVKFTATATLATANSLAFVTTSTVSDLWARDGAGNNIQLTSGGQLNTGTFAQISTPSNPASGYNKLYPKSDNKFYLLTSGGSELQLLTSSGTVTVVSITNANSPYTLTSSNSVVLATAASGAISIVFPSASANPGQLYRIKRTDATFTNVITLNRAGGDVFQAAAATSTTLTLNTQGEEYELVSDGSSTWQVLNHMTMTPTAAWTFVPNATAFGTVTNSNFYARRAGDRLEGIWFFTAGTVTANVSKIALPTGLTIDTAKIIPSIVGGLNSDVGNWQELTGTTFFDNDASHNFFGPLYVNAADSATLYFAKGTSASTDFSTLNANTGTMTNGSSYAGKFSIPITGWVV